MSININAVNPMYDKGWQAGCKSRNTEIEELKETIHQHEVTGDAVCHAHKVQMINQQAEIKKLREALDRIRPWISRITDGILADWQEDLCWDIDLICAEAIRSRGEE